MLQDMLKLLDIAWIKIKYPLFKTGNGGHIFNPIQKKSRNV